MGDKKGYYGYNSAQPPPRLAEETLQTVIESRDQRKLVSIGCNHDQFEAVIKSLSWSIAATTTAC